MNIDRRRFVLGSVSGLWLTATACSSATAGDNPVAPKDVNSIPVSEETFPHGVASGDPLSDRVLLWTRVATAARVVWVIARDSALSDVVASGTADALLERDFTVKVDAIGLAAGVTYYYAFALDVPPAGTRVRSPTGRTRTLPTGDVSHARIAYTSCANYNNGFFNAYRNIARRADLDVWVHLGDYIYEYADGVYGDATLGRSLVPTNETLTLDDYRKRYAHYRLDADLKELHRQLPLIAIWDDHEVANDAWKDGAQNHQPGEGDWETRKRAATQAFLEWLPVRVKDNALPPVIYRTFPFGNLFDLVMLDTRLIGRDKQVASTDTVGGEGKGTAEEWTDPTRTILGKPQEDWFNGELSASKARGATWRLIGNQVIFSPVRDPRDNAILATDMWDGYQASRSRVFAHIETNAIDNIVFLTGDIHTSWAFEVAPTPFDAATYDAATGRGSRAVEFVGPAVTSLGLEGNELVGAAPGLLTGANPHLKFCEVTRKGYVLVDITKERVQGEWYFAKDHKTKTDQEELAAAFTCASGSARLVRVTLS
jgi:alkaline phosphatase D